MGLAKALQVSEDDGSSFASLCNRGPIRVVVGFAKKGRSSIKRALREPGELMGSSLS